MRSKNLFLLFLFTMLVSALFYSWSFEKKEIPGRILGAPKGLGHLLREKKEFSPLQKKGSVGTFIVGGGIAGLSAAWWLQREGYEDFVLHELDEEVGGNARALSSASGEPFPVGAHYLPLPGEGAQYVRLLLEDLAVIRSYDKKGLPIYEERYLGADPHDRLFIHGAWQEGLIPYLGLAEKDLKEIKAFRALMEDFKQKRGPDGKRAFEIPLALSSQDPQFLRLDQISAKDFLLENNFSSKALHWYVNYCCLDDYGASLEEVSAWAAVAYFASRYGKAANAHSYDVLSWREGNAWIVHRLKEKLENKIKMHSLVVSVKKKGDSFEVITFKAEENIFEHYDAEHVIVAAPRFVSPYILPDFKEKLFQHSASLSYSSWLIAHLSLEHCPQGRGVSLSRENVPYGRASVGYIAVDHQDLTRYKKQSCDLVYYQPLVGEKETRKEILKRSHKDWAKIVLDEMEYMHPGVSSLTKNLDVWLWGHGMVIPKVGFLWGEARKNLQKSFGNLHFAHSDMSGISIFEEAQYHGIEAAQKILKSSKGE